MIRRIEEEKAAKLAKLRGTDVSRRAISSTREIDDDDYVLFTRHKAKNGNPMASYDEMKSLADDGSYRSDHVAQGVTSSGIDWGRKTGTSKPASISKSSYSYGSSDPEPVSKKSKTFAGANDDDDVFNWSGIFDTSLSISLDDDDLSAALARKKSKRSSSSRWGSFWS